MKISDRFTEYGLVGGFFLVGQFIVFLVWDQVSWVKYLTSFVDALPSPLKASFAGILAALAIIGIFFTGVLLDLMTPVYSFFELRNFKRHIDKNRGWLTEMTTKYKQFLTDDTALFISLPDVKYHPFHHKEWVSKCWRPFHLLRAFLFSLILLHSSIPEFSVLIDELHLWRTTRAFSVAIVILSIELTLPLIWMWLLSFPLSGNFYFVRYITIIILGLVMTIGAINFLAVTAVRTAHSRLCYSLFALSYLTFTKRGDESIPLD